MKEKQHASDRLAKAVQDSFGDSTEKFQREDGRQLHDVMARAVTASWQEGMINKNK